ncbi:hypothetical protein DFH07DRAFT_288675 [Mycena maculata]|uniref:Nuclear transport factor 2 n=1 Tax=Mycena maculata TaxID=230809 RepID=A0AAD7HJP6_9AGAR|nr:hypothetical protein DFH07DRAFT_288675 [Mycena maculata]
MADINVVAGQFVNYYYETFDNSQPEERAKNLQVLYRPSSMLTFEGTQLLGVEAIGERLAQLPKVQHKIVTLDAQPSSGAVASVLVSVTGTLAIDGENPMNFSQIFHLLPEAQSYYVFNDIFRLNIS